MTAYKHYENKLNHEDTIPIIDENERIYSTPFESRIEEKLATKQNLKFPGKLICIEKQDGIDNPLLVISDTGNNRIVIVNADTLKCIDVIGTGNIGLVDGSFTEACFHHP